MYFKKISQKAKEFWKKSYEVWKNISQKWYQAWKKATNSALNFTEEKLRNSKYVIKDKDNMKDLIDSSEEKKFEEKNTWIKKTFIRRSLLFVCDDTSEFTSKLLYKLPIIFTKSFSQNIYFWILLWDVEGIDVKKMKIESRPTLVLYENKKAVKYIAWEENIQKVVNSLNLNINKTIDEL